MAVPETRYARNGDVHIAYQEVGEGPITLVGIPPIVSNVELLWEHPMPARFLRRLASFSRFVHYDKRGQGLSDRDAGNPSIDDRLDDLAAVLDAAGIERCALSGISEGGSTAALFAAMHPERVTHLVLVGSFARPVGDGSDDGPGIPGELYDNFLETWAATWGTPDTLTIPFVTPSMTDDEPFCRWLNRFERQTCSPGGLLASATWVRALDLRPLLSNIQCPTLVVHRTGDQLVPLDQARHLAGAIPGARLLEVEGDDHLPWTGDQDAVLDAMEEFLVGRHAVDVDPDRVLATVLFTDIVGSTEQAASLGDTRWRQLLDEHDEVVARHVADARGRLVKHTGDGVLATFDGPIRAIRCAQDLRRELSTLGIDVRAGIHTGEVEVRGDDIGGLAVHIGARVGALAAPGEVFVSRTVADLVTGAGLEFEDRGVHALKGVPGQWQVFAAA